jgi:hypothetical protein
VSGVGDGFRAHAAALVERELSRHGSAFAALPPDRRAVVEALAVRAVAKAADGVLEHARADAAVASALASIYGADGVFQSAPFVGSALGAAD